MASLTAVRAGLAARLATITGLSPYSTAPGAVNVPAAVVVPGQPVVVYGEASADSTYMIGLRVLVLAGRTDDALAQDNLDGYLAGSGTLSVKAAIEADTTLGGVVSYAVVTQVSQYGPIDWAGVTYLGAAIEVEIMT